MTSILHPRQPDLNRSRDRAIADAGGQVGALADADPRDVVAECRSQGVKALEVRHQDLEFLRELPDLEFLSLNVTSPRIEPVHALGRLRGLAVDSWKGKLDFSRLPDLEWFSVVDVGKGQLDSLYSGHTHLHHLAVGKYREADLTALSRLSALVRLELYNTRSLQSLRGAEQLPRSLVALELKRCSKLDSLEGLASLENLEYLRLDSCNQLSDIEEVARLPNLRFLNVGGQRSIESLKSLAGHPRLEVLYFGKILDGDLDPLGKIPELRLVHSGPHRKELESLEIARAADLGWDHPLKAHAIALMQA